jgi:hypothetical protein
MVREEVKHINNVKGDTHRMKTISRIAVSAVCLAAALALTGTTVHAALVDPGFELNLTGPNPVVTGSLGAGWAVFGQTTNSTAQAFDGTHSLSITMNAGDAWDFQGGYQLVPASPGQVWTATAEYLNPGGQGGSTFAGAYLQLAFFNSTSPFVTPINPAASVNIVSPATWQQQTVSSTAPAGTAYAAVYVAYMLDGTQASPSTLYVDHVTLVPEPSTVGLVLTGLLGLVAFARKRRS